MALTVANARASSSTAELFAQASTTDEQKSPSTAADSAYDRYMKAGYEASDKKDYETALENFKKALQERPNDIYAQQAIQNVETYLFKDDRGNSVSTGLWWLSLGVGIAAMVGGGVFFVSSLLQKNSDPDRDEQDEQALLKEAFAPSPNQKFPNHHNAFEPDKKYELHSIPSEKSQNHFGGNRSKGDANDDNSLPIQTPTRLPNFDLIDGLVKDLQEPDPKKRRKAIWELAQKGDSRAMKPLVDLMIDSDSQERSLILEALSQISIRTLKPMNQALAISLQDKNPQVRKNAIRDLTRIYDLMSQISQMLRHAMDDSDADVQETARWALNQLNIQMTPTRLELLPMQQNESTP